MRWPVSLLVRGMAGSSSVLTFNVHNGYLDGVVRGYRLGLITRQQYSNFCQCETLEDLRVQLAATEYAEAIQHLPTNISTGVLGEVLRNKFVEEFRYLQRNASAETARFLDYISYEYQIDNVILIISGMLHGAASPEELTSRCHPLGLFEALPALTVARNVADVYHTVLVETPLAPYFRDCLAAQDLDELNVEIIRHTLYRAYLEDFYRYARQECGGATRDTLCPILEFEADRRVLGITINSLGMELSKDDRLRLFPKFGPLWESGVAAKLARVDEIAQIKSLVDLEYPAYRNLIEAAISTREAANDFSADRTPANGFIGEFRSLEEFFFEREVELCREAYFHQFSLAPLYSFVKLKEQEIRNVIWIAECIAQQQKENIHHYIPTI